MVKNVHDVLPYAVNFTVFAVIVAYLVRNPFKKFVFQRHERIKDQVGASARASEEAKKRIAGVNSALASFQQDVSRMSTEEIRSSTTEAVQIVEKAKKDAERIRLDAKKIAENEAQDLSDAARAEFLNQAIAAADAALRAGLKSEDHKSIMSDARSSIEAGV